MRTRLRSQASLSGLRILCCHKLAQISCCCGCGVGPAVVPPILPLAWKVPYAAGVALRKKQKPKKHTGKWEASHECLCPACWASKAVKSQSILFLSVFLPQIVWGRSQPWQYFVRLSSQICAYIPGVSGTVRERRMCREAGPQAGAWHHLGCWGFCSPAEVHDPDSLACCALTANEWAIMARAWSPDVTWLLESWLNRLYASPKDDSCI